MLNKLHISHKLNSYIVIYLLLVYPVKNIINMPVYKQWVLAKAKDSFSISNHSISTKTGKFCTRYQKVMCMVAKYVHFFSS